jgi:hypothetical protein
VSVVAIGGWAAACCGGASGCGMCMFASVLRGDVHGLDRVAPSVALLY